jgi:hypothetical protein
VTPSVPTGDGNLTEAVTVSKGIVRSYDFEDYDIFSNVAPAHLDGEVGHAAEQTIIIRPDRITADVMITPRLLIMSLQRTKWRTADTAKRRPCSD